MVSGRRGAGRTCGIDERFSYATGFSCIRMYGICGSLGDGFMYGWDWFGQPVYFALL